MRTFRRTAVGGEVGCRAKEVGGGGATAISSFYYRVEGCRCCGGLEAEEDEERLPRDSSLIKVLVDVLRNLGFFEDALCFLQEEGVDCKV